jgi:hypothetical protein
VDAFEQIDIDQLIIALGLQQKDISAAAIDTALLKYRRNELQDRIIAASNQRCGSYLRVLVASRGQAETLWGSLSVLLGATATAIAHPLTIKAFAAGSTVSSGVLSKYNEAYFQNLTVSVISGGITRQRQEILKAIDAQRTRGLVEYPVNRAVADALSYHSACNVVSGLEAAAAATKGAGSMQISGLSDGQGVVSSKASLLEETGTKAASRAVEMAFDAVVHAPSLALKTAREALPAIEADRRLPQWVWNTSEKMRETMLLCRARLSALRKDEADAELVLAKPAEAKALKSAAVSKATAAVLANVIRSTAEAWADAARSVALAVRAPAANSEQARSSELPLSLPATDALHGVCSDAA